MDQCFCGNTNVIVLGIGVFSCNRDIFKKDSGCKIYCAVNACMRLNLMYHTPWSMAAPNASEILNCFVFSIIYDIEALDHKWI